MLILWVDRDQKQVKHRRLVAEQRCVLKLFGLNSDGSNISDVFRALYRDSTHRITMLHTLVVAGEDRGDCFSVVAKNYSAIYNFLVLLNGNKPEYFTAEGQLSADARTQFLDLLGCTPTVAPLNVDWHWCMTRIYFPLWWPLLSLLIILSCLKRASREEDFIVDLPWQKPWMWFVGLLALPVGMFVFPASFCRMVLSHRRILRDERIARELSAARELSDRNARSVAALSLASVVKSPTLEPSLVLRRESLATAWIALRSEYGGHAFDAHKAKLDQRLNQLRDTLDSAGRDLIRRQGEYATTQLEVEKFSKMVRPMIAVDEARERTYFLNEFERLLKFFVVRDLKITENRIELLTSHLIVAASCFPTTRFFDLGSYRIVLTIAGASAAFSVFVFENTRFVGYGIGHIYGANDGTGAFCFADRRFTIDQLLERGEYLSALSLMLEGLMHVNLGHQSELPRYYPEVTHD